MVIDNSNESLEEIESEYDTSKNSCDEEKKFQLIFLIKFLNCLESTFYSIINLTSHRYFVKYTCYFVTIVYKNNLKP